MPLCQFLRASLLLLVLLLFFHITRLYEICRVINLTIKTLPVFRNLSKRQMPNLLRIFCQKSNLILPDLPLGPQVFTPVINRAEGKINLTPLLSHAPFQYSSSSSRRSSELDGELRQTLHRPPFRGKYRFIFIQSSAHFVPLSFAPNQSRFAVVLIIVHPYFPSLLEEP